MTINATQRFPMDQLLQCGQCGAPMHLEDRPGPVYTCAGSSNQKEPCQTPALRAAGPEPAPARPGDERDHHRQHISHC